MNQYEGHYYTVTDEAITPTGKVEIYTAKSRDEAVLMALYTHRLHNGRAWATNHGVIVCPSCGQIAIVSKPAADYPLVWTPDGLQYAFGSEDAPIQPNLF